MSIILDKKAYFKLLDLYTEATKDGEEKSRNNTIKFGDFEMVVGYVKYVLEYAKEALKITDDEERKHASTRAAKTNAP